MSDYVEAPVRGRHRDWTALLMVVSESELSELLVSAVA
jgi:hypothetical protein